MSDVGFAVYGRLLAVPPRFAMVLAGLLARIPTAVIGFGFLYFVHASTGAYSVAGLTAALAIAARGLVAPVAGRIADRRGQRGLLLVSAIAHPLAIAGAIVAGSLGSIPGLLVLSVFSGVTVAPVGAFMRARWSTLVEDGTLLRTAFAIEAIADELTWVVGPALAALLASGLTPPGGLILSGVVGPIGALVLRSLPDAQPVRSASAGRSALATAQRPGRLLTSVPFLSLILASFAVGVGFGINDLSVVSMATRDGVPEFAGIVLTAYSIGSVTGGLLVGAFAARSRAWTLLLATSIAFFIAWSLLSLAPSIVWFFPVGFLAGATVAPFMIAANHAAREIVPRAVITEALSWLNMVLVVAVSLGTLAGGIINDAAGPRVAFSVVACTALVPALSVLAASRAFRRAERAHPVVDEPPGMDEKPDGIG